MDRRSLLAYLLFVFLYDAHLWSPVLMLYLQGQGLSLADIGRLDAAHWSTAAMAGVLIAGIADRIGRRRSMVAGAVLGGICLLAILAPVRSWTFLIGYVIWGVSDQLVVGTGGALLYDGLLARGEESQYLRVASVARIVSHCSRLITALVGGWLATIDVDLVFQVNAGLSLGAGVCALLLRDQRAAVPQPAEDSGRSSAAEGVWGAAGLGQTLRVIGRARCVLPLLVLNVAISVFGFAGSFVLMPPFAGSLGVGYGELGWITMIMGGASLIGFAVSPWLYRRLGASRLIGTVIALMAAAFAGIWLLPVRGSLALFATLVFLAAAAQPALSDRINLSVPNARRAGVLTLDSTLFMGALVGVEWALLAYADRAGVPAASGWAALALAIIGVLGMSAWRRAEEGADSTRRTCSSEPCAESR